MTSQDLQGKPSRRLRVLQVIPVLTPGGAERMAVSLATNLDPRRFESGLLCFFDRVGSALESELDDSRVKTWYLGKRPGFDPRMFLRFDEVIREFRPDVVHTHLVVLKYLLPSLTLHRIPVRIHTLHTTVQGERKTIVGKVVHSLAFRSGVWPVLLGEHLAPPMREIYGIEPRAIIPNGIPLLHYRRDSGTRAAWRAEHQIPEQTWVVVAVGRLNALKNHALLLEAFRLIPEGALLLLVGQGELEQELKSLVRDLGLEPRVRFLGMRNDVPAILSASDCFVLSSVQEGIPLSVAEAMAAEVPVVATDVGGIREMITHGENGLLVKSGDASGLAEAMESLRTSPEKGKSFAQASLVRVKARFELGAMVRAYQDLYLQGLSQKKD